MFVTVLNYVLYISRGCSAREEYPYNPQLNARSRSREPRTVDELSRGDAEVPLSCVYVICCSATIVCVVTVLEWTRDDLPYNIYIYNNE